MIQTKNLSIRFADGSGIRYRDMTFDDGRSYALLGASGCGKTTFLNLLSGLLTPAEGSVLVDGRDIAALSPRERDRFRIHRVGYIFQDFKLLEELTVQDNLDVLRLEGVDTSDMDTLLDRLGILRLKRRRVRRLSGGEKQRVAIARALIKKPALILADEPTGNLNFETGAAVVQTLLDNAGGGTLIAVTHDDRLAPRFDEALDMNGIASWRSGREAE